MILIVEDDPQVARLIALVLQRHGRDCQIVADGQTALSRAREMRPSMILADLTIKGAEVRRRDANNPLHHPLRRPRHRAEGPPVRRG